MEQSPDAVSSLMGRFRQGDRTAANQLVELLYPQLKKLASSRMRRESPYHTWQPTVLVNELYLELIKIRALQPSSDGGDGEKTAFLKLSAHLMRRLLIHHSRPLAKHVAREEINEEFSGTDRGNASLEEIDCALDRLAAIDPQLRTVVELRVFEGLTGEEIAERMGCSPRTVTRYWNFSRNWLAQELGTFKS
ncbi:MAG TPA: ECF-type sigma factor [Bryobacteraceae bacterium]|nr:ECF-type sigma factor [Bryobacteraceae bacterium]